MKRRRLQRTTLVGRDFTIKELRLIKEISGAISWIKPERVIADRM